jgi:hypothetical protein
VRGDRGETEHLAVVEDRHRDRHVGAVRGAQEGVVVHDDVAVSQIVFQAVQKAADVPRQRADVHRRGVRLAQLPTLGVEDAGAEVLGLADDRGVGHAEQHARHLLGDGVEGAAEDTHRDRVDIDPSSGGSSGRPAHLVGDE